MKQIVLWVIALGMGTNALVHWVYYDTQGELMVRSLLQMQASLAVLADGTCRNTKLC